MIHNITKRYDCGTKRVGTYVVALIDILGQSDALDQWRERPRDEFGNNSSFWNGVLDSYGKVHMWRKMFERTFSRFKEISGTLRAQEADKLADSGPSYLEFGDMSLGFSHFSDTIIVFSPIKNQYGFFNVVNLAAFPCVSGMLLLHALADGTALRGAVEIGMAGEFPDFGFYGPVLADAHRLESKCADYPRIMIGRQLIHFLRKSVENPEPRPFGEANRVLTGDLLLPLIAQDDKGCHFVDYLGQSMKSFANECDPGTWENLCGQAMKFVMNARDRFKGKGNRVADDITEKYNRVFDYFRSRKIEVPSL